VDTLKELDKQIEEGRRKVGTDNFRVTFGELSSMYERGELIVYPEFQRNFRWTNIQKSRLIESIILGIPLPSIFVSSNKKGEWEVIDGTQRLSTILQMQGLLGDEFPPFTFEGAELVTELNGAIWDKSYGGEFELPRQYKLSILRSSIPVTSILQQSDPRVKFDLFQRLNSYGTPLTNQELRNSALYYAKPEFVRWIQTATQHESFVKVANLSEKRKAEGYDAELILRFLFASKMNSEEILNIKDFNAELNKFALSLASSFDENQRETLDTLIDSTFRFIENENSQLFRRWDEGKKEFTGAFSLTSYEMIAYTVGYAVLNNIQIVNNLSETLKQLWKELGTRYATGKSTEQRIHMTVPIAHERLLEHE
jgi:hypothetical protein